MTVLGKVHAAYWQSSLLERDSLAPIGGVVGVEELQQLLAENLAVHESADYSFPYLRECMHHVRELAPWLVAEVNQFAGAMTLVHGDFHTRNIHFTNDRAVVFDWQVTERGRPARDLVYWMLICLDAEDVETFKSELTERYLATLESEGVNYESRAFQRDYRDAVMELLPRAFCYQTLITLTEEDEYFIEKVLRCADAMAKSHYVRAQLRVARVLAPPVIQVLRWLGKR